MKSDRTHGDLAAPDLYDPALAAAAGYLAGYGGSTAIGYRIELRAWFTWCTNHQIPVLEVKRFQIELFGRQMEESGYARSTTSHRLSTIAGFYRYCEAEEVLEKSPARYVRRPKVSMESTTLGLDRIELGAFVAQAQADGPLMHALTCLLGLNGLRIGETCASSIEDLSVERGHRTLHVVGKGHKPATIPLSPRTARAVDAVVGDRLAGPILIRNGERIDRWAAIRMVRATAKRAGITKKISPHSLRHSFITAALDAGVPLRDVQIAARHADPRTTTRYDRNRLDLDRHATYVVTAFVAGAA